MKPTSAVLNISVCILTACTSGQNNSAEVNNPMDTSISRPAAESITPAGIYTGVIPCADCMGIEYTLYLQRDSIYFLRQIYYKEPVSQHILVDSGKWIEKDSSIIVLEFGESKILFRMEKYSLLLLDGEGKEITDMPANLRLAKTGTY